MLTDACCVGTIVPIIDFLGHLAARSHNMTDQPWVVPSPLESSMLDFYMSLDEA